MVGSEYSSERAGDYAKDTKIQIRVQIERFTTWDRVSQVVFDPATWRPLLREIQYDRLGSLVDILAENKHPSQQGPPLTKYS